MGSFRYFVLLSSNILCCFQ